MATAVGETWRRNSLHVELDPQKAESLSAPGNGLRATDDIVERIRSEIKTVATAASELSAQRWYFESLAECGFAIKRFQAANRAMQVFALGHGRARLLYDLTILEARRVVIDDRRIPVISPQSLRSTRLAGFTKFAKYLSTPEFSKLAVLLKDLPPSLVVSAKPENIRGFRTGDAELIRENLKLLLDGDPKARPLFPRSDLS
jgi:hypothetical protein